MGNKFLRRMIAVFVAAAMIMTCGIGVFAASGSPTKGKITSTDSVGATNCKTLNITWKVDKAADSYIVTVGDKSYTTTSTSLSVPTTPGKTYTVSITPVYKGKNGTTVKSFSRWMRTTKITKVKAGKKKVKLTWKRTKGAKKYQVLMYKNGSWQVVKTTKKLSATIKVSKKGKYKFKVRPMKGSYYGVRSKTKTGKAK